MSTSPGRGAPNGYTTFEDVDEPRAALEAADVTGAMFGVLLAMLSENLVQSVKVFWL